MATADFINRQLTLVIFCREPIPNQAKTRLIKHLGAAGAAALAEAFILDAVAKCRMLSPARLVIAGTGPRPVEGSVFFRAIARRFDATLIDQGAGSLGARMERALASFAARGVILIGTDTPSLPPAMIARSAALLGRSRVVLGPSLDGGYYLVGGRGALPDMFCGIRWSSTNVLAKTIARLAREGVRPALGPGWYDVDRWRDVELLAAHLAAMRPPRSPDHPQTPCPATARALVRLGLLRTGR